jgi:hypothetical protein
VDRWGDRRSIGYHGEQVNECRVGTFSGQLSIVLRSMIDLEKNRRPATRVGQMHGAVKTVLDVILVHGADTTAVN